MKPRPNKNAKKAFKNYIKKYPATVLSTICVGVELICFFLFTERINIISVAIMFLTTFIYIELHEKSDNELSNSNQNSDWD